jgi:hypothetical protein
MYMFYIHNNNQIVNINIFGLCYKTYTGHGLDDTANVFKPDKFVNLHLSYMYFNRSKLYTHVLI